MNIDHIRQTEIVNIGDPYILRANGAYYLYATSFTDGFHCRRSTDLEHWSEPVYAYKAGKASFGSGDFWAPEVVEENGKFVMHYTARRKKDDRLLIGVALSDSPDGPFVDVYPGEPMFDFGYAAIDGHVLKDGDRRYLFFDRDCSQHTVNGINESHILAVELDQTLTKAVSEPVPIIKPDCPWETATGDFRWNEGAFVFKKEGWYYLMYSSGYFAAPTYSIGYAVSRAPLGPYVKAAENPILHSVPGAISGPGHNSVVTGPDGLDYCVFHVHTDPARPSADRRVCMCPIRFADGKITLP